MGEKVIMATTKPRTRKSRKSTGQEEISAAKDVDGNVDIPKPASRLKIIDMREMRRDCTRVITAQSAAAFKLAKEVAANGVFDGGEVLVASGPDGKYGYIATCRPEEIDKLYKQLVADGVRPVEMVYPTTPEPNVLIGQDATGRNTGRITVHLETKEGFAPSHTMVGLTFVPCHPEFGVTITVTDHKDGS